MVASPALRGTFMSLMQVQSNTDLDSLVLSCASGCELSIVPEFGGNFNRLRFVRSDGQPLEVVAGLADRQGFLNDKAYRGIALFPVVNRLDAGHYTFAGQEHQMAVNEALLNNRLHGFLQDLKPRVETQQDETCAKASLHYDYGGEVEGYPFPAEVTMDYVLYPDNRLEVTMAIHNRHSSAIPASMGWHPYFQLGGSVDDWEMQLPSVKRIEVNQRLLPTGRKLEDGRFIKRHSLREIHLDDCFAISSSEVAGRESTQLWNPALGHGLELWQQTGPEAFNYIQVCIDGHRRSIAIEPVTSNINAFVNGEDLLVIKAGSKVSAQFGLRLLENDKEQ